MPSKIDRRTHRGPDGRKQGRKETRSNKDETGRVGIKQDTGRKDIKQGNREGGNETRIQAMK